MFYFPEQAGQQILLNFPTGKYNNSYGPIERGVNEEEYEEEYEVKKQGGDIPWDPYTIPPGGP